MKHFMIAAKEKNFMCNYSILQDIDICLKVIGVNIMALESIPNLN